MNAPERTLKLEHSKVDAKERKLGRYELFYELGSGGMASVFLARARGPAGFQKWFAIKRVHDTLAKDTAFVDMFLDEARIAAAIEHPNVAQVIDLGEAEGRYFLAMEYLHGEALHIVRSRAGDRDISPAMAAHIIARAADGLHHAHEATDASGKPMGLVHRDVSPQNVFLTYDGQVKLTDFGVAKAAGRITTTNSGEVKGKLAYASPEQLRGETLDRRSDIFALGIVLWELATAQRLFRGQSEAETIARIFKGYQTPPSSVVPGFPGELEKILERALAYKTDDRYANAAQMARDLDRFVVSSGLDAPRDSLGELMRSLFAEEIADRNAALHGISSSGTVPKSEIPNEPSHSALRPSMPRSTTVRRSPWRWITPVVVLALAATAIAAFVLWPRTSLVRIDSSPAGAHVWIDGAAREGVTPLLLEDVPQGRHRIALELDGHAVQEGAFEASGARVELSYALRPEESEPETERETAEVPPPIVANPEPAPIPEPERPAAANEDRTERRAPRGTAELTLITRPWARVWIDGRPAGDTPFARRSVPAGRLRVRLQPQGEGPSRTIVINAADGEHVSQNINLAD